MDYALKGSRAVDIFFYILTGVAVLTLLFIGTGEFLLEKKKFVWYHYIPQAVINAALGLAGPSTLFFMLEHADENKSWVLGILYLCGVLLNNLLFFAAFFRKPHFNVKFYWTTAIFFLCVVSFWGFEWMM